MELSLTGKTKIKDLKKQFSKHFPFLKLEFFSYGHHKGGSSVLAKVISDGTLLAEIAPAIQEQTFAFTPSTTVAEFEQRLQNEYSLPVQVYRKAGNLWLETVQTDNLSLAKQNTMGAESSRAPQFNKYTLFL
jgi:hypothetical protein